ncbi:MAG: hypothetical protein HQL52_18640 [Magnetococcales bacterium]|nr:hypothetical protein [Magnetococcales bacterium]
MTIEPIIESGMTFIGFPEEACFRIETSTAYTRRQQNRPIPEFLLLRDSQIWIIEAKSSSPNPNNPASRESLTSFADDIGQKMHNAILMFLGLHLGWHGPFGKEMPTTFHNLDLKKTQFKLILIIKGHKKEWLPPINDACRTALSKIMGILGPPPYTVAVINDQMAKKHNLIQ